MADSARDNEDCKEYIDSADVLDKKVTKLAALIKKSKYIIAFTGAGISTSAGIPDFRSGINTSLKTGAGKWALEAAKKKGINVDDQKQNWTGIMKGPRIKAIPTATHMMLVKLAQMGTIKYLISQNTDGLHRKSGFPIDKLSELHGNGNLEICGTCGKQYLRDYRVRNKKIARTVNEKRRKIDPNEEPYARHKHWTGRYCTATACVNKRRKSKKKNAGKLYDTVVAFGENLDQTILGNAEQNTKKADLCISMGSSLLVSPARDMPFEIGIKRHIKTSQLCIVNLQKTPLDKVSSIRIFGKTDQFSQLLMKKLNIDIPQWRLDRFAVISVKDGNNDKKIIKMYACDSDGTRYDIFSKCILRLNDKELIQETDDPKKSLEFAVFNVDKWGQNKMELEMEFMGHYKEPNLCINLNEYLMNDHNQAIILNMEYNPFKREWIVDKMEQQLKNDYVKKIYNNLGISMNTFNPNIDYDDDNENDNNNDDQKIDDNDTNNNDDINANNNE